MPFTLAMAQINPHVGALEENLERMVDAAARAKATGVDLVVYPELSISGYPPEDLLHKPLFIQRMLEVEQRFIARLAELEIDAVYGTARPSGGGGGGLLNVAVFIQEGREAGFVAKWRLPNYSVFDEKRYFVAGTATRVIEYRGVPLGLTVCEDIWGEDGPLKTLADAGCRLAININASPYNINKREEREKEVLKRVRETGLPVVYVNQVGGQDELVFDGGSFAMNRNGEIAGRSHFFAEDLQRVRVALKEDGTVFLDADRRDDHPAPKREIYAALALGLKDYVRKNGFDGVVIGLSGGIDSALTAAVCVDALGPEKVELVMMPSQYTSRESLEDAAEMAERLGIPLINVPIDPMFEVFKRSLADEFAGMAEDVTEENIQPRIRATILMAISNKKGKLLVTTGNKSEVSMGYATLYGDMAGGYSVLVDVLKTLVFDLSWARNAWAEAEGKVPPIPERIITKPPSAELKPDQKDTDSLPPYDELDAILKLYVEEEKSLDEVVAAGMDRSAAVRVIRAVDRNEYKRRQAAPGVRITGRAFGKDRRYPLTNGFRVG